MAASITLFLISIFMLLLSLLLLPIPCHSADPDPLQDFCIADLRGALSLNGFPCKPTSKVTSDDFVYSGLMNEGNTSNYLGSFLNVANIFAFPGLNTLGVSMTRIDIAVGGVTNPHWHARATECGVLIRGKALLGIITSRNVVYARNISVGEMYVVPRGLLHYHLNVGEEPVLAFSAANSQLPGTIYIAQNLFGSTPSVPDQVLAKAFQLDQSVVDQIKSKFVG
ncbi:germin-like protein subfamily T member 2 [Dorcoceras hygrometricum]|uniref:Germin-like protein n=1 Tax=Dorcoceras hygrometricum TaxID=472368 RepID=A0A2Z7C1E2_9LAMI|nr:germin-like protein subfamily T member 2 [Dorcoceras hygrometricum]